MSAWCIPLQSARIITKPVIDNKIWHLFALIISIIIQITIMSYQSSSPPPSIHYSTDKLCGLPLPQPLLALHPVLSLPHKLKPLLSANPNIVSLFNNSPQTVTIYTISTVLSSPHRPLPLLPRRPVNPWIKLLLQPVCLSVPLPAKNKHTRWLLDGRGTFIPRCHVISLPYSIQFLSSSCSPVLAPALLLDDWLHVVVSAGRFVCLLLGFVL